MATFEQAPPGDAKSGEKIFRTKCAQCHTIDKGAGHKQGTRLFANRFPYSVFGDAGFVICYSFDRYHYDTASRGTRSSELKNEGFFFPFSSVELSTLRLIRGAPEWSATMDLMTEGGGSDETEGREFG
ncbi:unnamed protein product [Rhodiola kirilowii]